MKVELISIGDELLIGATVNTNAAYIAAALTRAGAALRWMTTVGDDKDELQHAVRLALSRADVVITTGGLGPTHDDITKKIIAEYFDSPLIFNRQIYDRLDAFFRSRGKTMPESNRCQAEVPEKAEVLPNPFGTAPGLLFHENESLLFVLPGVPVEAERMTLECVLPRLQSMHLCKSYLEKYLHTMGIGESALAEILVDFETVFPEIKRASLPGLFGTTLRLSVYGNDPELQQMQIRKAADWIRECASQWIYGEDQQTLEGVVGGILTERRLTLSIAESCSGGFIANRITDVPGSSVYFDRGVVTYSNRAKMEMLGVPESTLEAFGAVSEGVAAAMAEGIRKISGCDYGLAVTGIAGPTGGTKEKPVGTVFIACSDAFGTVVEKQVFFKDRLMNKSRTAGNALDLLRRRLLEIT